MKNHEKRTNHERYAARMSRLRSATVEPVLETLINLLGMKRVNTRGIGGAEKHVLMAPMYYNLQKLLRFKPKQSGAIAIKMQAKTESFVVQFVYHYQRKKLIFCRKSVNYTKPLRRCRIICFDKIVVVPNQKKSTFVP